MTEHTATNKLCLACIHPCKQDTTSKIVSCPKFQKIPSDRQFRTLVDEINEAETRAKKLQKRIRNTIETTLGVNTEEHQADCENEENEDTIE